MTRFSSSTNYHGILAVKVFCRYIYKIGIGAETEKRILHLVKSNSHPLAINAKLMAVALAFLACLLLCFRRSYEFIC